VTGTGVTGTGGTVTGVTGTGVTGTGVTASTGSASTGSASTGSASTDSPSTDSALPSAEYVQRVLHPLNVLESCADPPNRALVCFLLQFWSQGHQNRNNMSIRLSIFVIL
jgi:hypothetical protein